MMYLSCFTLSLLCAVSWLSPGLCFQCDEKTYAWPVKSSTMCCDKCKPGFHMKSRSQAICDTKCQTCGDQRYMDTYNLKESCKVCDRCKKTNFEIKTPCTATSNTVCKCKHGFRCGDADCKECLPMATTTIKTTVAFKTAGPVTKERTTTKPPKNERTTNKPPKPEQDTMWFLVIIALLCAGIALVVVTKLKVLLHWIRANHGYFLTDKTPRAIEVEDVSQPVQEVCDKCDKLLEV